MVIGEGPGWQEEKYGRPFVGKSGQELDRYLRVAGLHRENVYITNLVKYRVKDDGDPTPDDIARDETDLIVELRTCRPLVIVTLGQFATRHLLGEDVTMEYFHSLPWKWTPKNRTLDPATVFPIYHPAAGLHNANVMTQCWWGWKQLGRFLRNPGSVRPPKDAHPSPDYLDLTTPEEVRSVFTPGPVAIDTEGTPTLPWCLSFAHKPGTGYVIRSTSTDALEEFKECLAEENPEVILHNSLWDLPVLREMGIVPARYTDTMIMAYLLGSEPQGLKPLAFRHCGMEMLEYEELTRDVDDQIAAGYLSRVLEEGWVNCPACLKGRISGKRPNTTKKCPSCKGEARAERWPPQQDVLYNLWDDPSGVTNPWPIRRLVESIIRGANPEGKSYRQRWEGIDPERRDPVERDLGSMPQTTLDALDLSRVVSYAARDADATYRVWEILSGKIRELSLDHTLDLDLSIIPMVETMQRTGILLDQKHFKTFDADLARECQVIRQQIWSVAQKDINPSSTYQVGDLLYKDLGMPVIEKTKTGIPSTDDTTIQTLQIRHPHPVLDLISDYRERDKLRGTYTKTLPRMVDENGRVHTRFKVTRTATGRLACVSGDTLLPTSRGVFRFDEYIPLPDDLVVSHLGRFCRVIRKIYKGVDSMFRVGLSSGSWINCTMDHRLLTPSGWRRLGDLVVGSEVCTYESVQTFHEDPRQRGKGVDRLLGGGQTNTGRSGSADGNDLRYGELHCPETSGPRTVQDGESSTILPVQDGGEISDVGQIRTRTPELERGLSRSQGVHNPHSGWEEVLHTPYCDGGGNRDPRPGFTGGPDCSPHRSRQDEQRSVESGIGEQQGSRSAARQSVAISEITPLGDMDVWDIEVEGDHSYAAHGFLNHNSAEPNLMNQPTRSELGRKIREGFVARPGYLLGAWDLDQIEMRILAHESEDENLVRLFVEGSSCPIAKSKGKCSCHDIHRFTASKIFNKSPEEITEDERSSAKSCGFGIVYGISAEGLQLQMHLRGKNTPLEECQRMIDDYLKVAYPGVLRFMERKFTEARRWGYVRDMFGRIRYVTGVWSQLEWVAAEALRAAGNSTIQSGAQGVIKLAMAGIDQRVLPTLREVGYEVFPLIQVHDELVFEFPEGLEEVMDRMIMAEMTGAIQLRVPLGAKGHWGKRWSELK